MKVDVDTPSDGNPTQRSRRAVPDSIKLALPISLIGVAALGALGWAWKLDIGRAVDHQRIDDHEQFIRRFETKLDDLKDLIISNKKP